MKFLSTITAFGVGGCLAVNCLAQVGATTESYQPAATGAQVAQTTARGQRSEINAPAIRASELLGLNVENPKGESIGEINDLVMNTDNGKTAYIAMSVGGLLGIGDEMFAVPYDAFAIKPADKDEQADATSENSQVADDLGEFVAVIDANEETFEDAEGFNQDKWPNMADPKWRQKNDQAYQKSRDSRMRATNNPAMTEQRRREAAADRQAMKTYATYRASELVGLNIDMPELDETAEIQDVVLATDSGKVKYVALTLDGKYYALPPKALQVTKSSDGDITAKVTADKQWFDSQQPFSENSWPGNVSSARKPGRTGATSVQR